MSTKGEGGDGVIDLSGWLDLGYIDGDASETGDYHQTAEAIDLSSAWSFNAEWGARPEMPKGPIAIGFDVAGPIGYEPAERLPWWQRLWRKLRRQPLPKPTPIYPPGTLALAVTTVEDGVSRILYLPHVKARAAT